MVLRIGFLCIVGGSGVSQVRLRGKETADGLNLFLTGNQALEEVLADHELDGQINWKISQVADGESLRKMSKHGNSSKMDL